MARVSLLPANMQLQRAAVLAWFPIFSGCYASVGPTVGLDMKTGRATLGVEGSGETFTLAHSVALGARPLERDSNAKDWSTHSYLLWEPGFGGTFGDQTDENFVFFGAGLSAGVRLNRYDGAPLDADFVMGAWTSGGEALISKQNHECEAHNVRPFAALVVGLRGYELYASPKIGVMDVPSFCFDFGHL